MLLIVGPIASGKRTYANSLGFSAAQMSADVESSAPVVYDVQEAVREMLCKNPDKQAVCDELCAKLATHDVVIATEVGSGVIPLTSEDRLFRETAGRLNVVLAQRADQVIRMVWGIPVLVKGAPADTLHNAESAPC